MDRAGAKALLAFSALYGSGEIPFPDLKILNLVAFVYLEKILSFESQYLNDSVCKKEPVYRED